MRCFRVRIRAKSGRLRCGLAQVAAAEAQGKKRLWYLQNLIPGQVHLIEEEAKERRRMQRLALVAVAASLVLMQCGCQASVLCGVACRDGAVLLLDNSLGEGGYFGSRGAALEFDAPIKRVSPYLHTAIAYGGSRRGLHLLWHRVRKELDRSLVSANIHLQEAVSSPPVAAPDALPVRAVATVVQRVMREQPHILDHARKSEEDDDEGGEAQKHRKLDKICNVLVVGVEENEQPTIYEIAPGGYLLAHSHAAAPAEQRPIALGSNSPTCVAIAQALEQLGPAELETTASVQRCLADICWSSNIAGRVQRRLISLAVMNTRGDLAHKVVDPNS